MISATHPKSPLEPTDLDDAARLLAADSEGRLRGAASAGALVRSVAEDARRGVLASLQSRTVRSVVLVAARGPARHAALLLQALVGDVATMPVVHAAQTPRWVGALDVVVVATDDPGDAQLAQSVASAVGRGAEVVLCAPVEGLLAPAAAGRALALPPRVWVPDGMGLLHFAAAGLAVLTALRACATPDLAAVADELDAEAERNQAGREVFANPAKALALRCSGNNLVLAADSTAPGVLAAHLAGSLLSYAGIVAVPVELAQALVAQPVSGGDSVQSLFHDPEIDGPLPVTPLRVVLLGTASERTRLQARSAALTDVELALGSIESGVLQEDPIAELLQLAARCETAAVYLGLATAQN